MSAILSELKNIILPKSDEEDEFVYFWDDIQAEEAITKERVSFSEIIRKNQLFLIHLLLVIAILPLAIAAFENRLDILTLSGVLVYLLALVSSYYTTWRNFSKPYDVIEKSIDDLAEKKLAGSDELLYSKSEYSVLQNLDLFRRQLLVNLRTYQINLDRFQEEINRTYNQINRTHTQLDAVNLGLDNSLANVANFQETKGYLHRLSDGIDAFTGNFDRALNGIDEISSIVQSIGKQTTMLALNAGIEAARAGKYGTGFEVVASNLRRLAQHATKSSNDIKNLSNEINVSAKEALEGITDGMSQLQRKIDQTQEIITDYNNEIYDVVLQLANVGTEQQQLMSKISELSLSLDTYEF